MRERKVNKQLLFYIIIFTLATISYFFVPIAKKGDVLWQEDVWWPFNLMSDGELMKLTFIRGWIINYLPLFFGVLLVLEMLSTFGILNIPKNKTVKIVAGVLFLILFLSLQYFIIYSLENLWPAWPMSMKVWSVIFGQKKFLWAWWALPAVCLHVTLKA